jgi:alpha-glucuronidase
MDRTVATGTAYIGQYSPEAAREFESPARCPDNLLLFMHHVPWTYVLHSGKTVIQYFYDAHYEGAETAQEFPREWRGLRGRIDEERFAAVLDRLEYQAGHAVVWRDFVNDWAARISGIPDAQGRVGHHPGRVEAEAMQLQGYRVFDVQPAEAASGGRAVACVGDAPCTAGFRFDGAPGWYDIAVQYFDQANGVSHYRLLVGSQVVGTWNADRALPADAPGADSSTRRTVRGVALRPGDSVRVEGTPDGGERAPLDYVEIRGAGGPAVGLR